MENEIDQEVDEIVDFPEVGEDEEDTTDWKAEALKQQGIAKRLKTKLEKSKEVKPEVKPVEPLKTNEPDYAKEAYLEQKGYAHPDDKKVIYDEAERLKLPLTDIMSMEHIKAKLASAKTQREAMDGMPKGNGRTSGKTVNDVDYHLAKGTTPDDLALANKVIDARMKQEQSSSRFSDELFTG